MKTAPKINKLHKSLLFTLIAQKKKKKRKLKNYKKKPKIFKQLKVKSLLTLLLIK